MTNPNGKVTSLATESGQPVPVTRRVAEASSPSNRLDGMGCDVYDLWALSHKLVITLEGADLIIAPCPFGFKYQICTNDSIDEDTLAEGEIVLSDNGKLLLLELLLVFRTFGNIRCGRFECRIIAV